MLEAIPYKSLATGVLPVNVIFFTVLFSQISFPTGITFFCVVTMLITPSGNPARLANFLRGQPDILTDHPKSVPLRVQGQRMESLVVAL